MRHKALSLALALFVVMLSPPFRGGAQESTKIWRIGVMHVGLDHVPPSLAPLRDELRTLGYEDGRNIRLDFRSLADQAAAYTVARQFVGDRVDLIVAFEEQAMRGVKAATSENPVVFLHLVDPVADGFIGAALVVGEPPQGVGAAGRVILLCAGPPSHWPLGRSVY